MNSTITGHTTLIGLLGSPVSHSISPSMHNEAFQQLGLDFAYLAFDVAPEELEAAVHGLRALKVRGFNVTMPHKNRIPQMCDELSPVAQITGAVNTVINDHGLFIGHTTDGIGYMESVKENGIDIIGQKITVLGAGGAATAIIAQAAFDGVREISIFNGKGNSFDRMTEIIQKLNTQTDCILNLYTYESEDLLRQEISESILLVNTTPVGMAPHTEDCLIKDATMFHKNLTVSDIIYNPEETQLLRLAKTAGCKTFNGLSMLLHQGAASFQLWTGKDMPIETIKEKYFKR